MAFQDLTALKKKGTFFYFQSTITNKVVILKAFVKSLSDQYSSNWAEERVHGRMDPIPTYSGTARRIAFDLEIVAGSLAEAQSNLEKVQTIIQSMYPEYESSTSGATGMQKIPLMKVKYANLIQGKTSGKALLGYVPQFSFDPNFDDLLFYTESDKNSSKVGEVFPKIINFSFEMGVIHEHIVDANSFYAYGAASTTKTNAFASEDSPPATDADVNALRGINESDVNQPQNPPDVDETEQEMVERLRGIRRITESR